MKAVVVLEIDIATIDGLSEGAEKLANMIDGECTWHVAVNEPAVEILDVLRIAREKIVMEEEKGG